MSSDNNKRIAKNTLFLYFRMLLIMGVTLFSVRIVLDVLGVVDYGIYNVVGGVVTMLSFLSSTMSFASQRFFAYELGKNDLLALKKTFSASVTIFFLIALAILILGETAGLWFVKNKLTIPLERQNAATYVYHFSLLSFVASMLMVPYNAIIIAHEKMKIYAIISIVEAILKLGVVFMLILFNIDKLVLYSILILIVTSLVTLSYKTVCNRLFKVTKYRFTWDKKLYITLLSFSGWNLFGAVSNVFRNQGVNILLNLFFGPVINTARGISYQIYSVVNQFVLNFSTAARPQITKYYAQSERDKMMELVQQSSKYSFFLLFILSLPIIFETEYVLSLWLKEVPTKTIIFTKLVLIMSLIDSLSYSLQATAQATGRIKYYQIIVGSLILLNLPLAYIFLKMDYAAEVTLYIAIFISVAALALRLVILRHLINFNIRTFVLKVVNPILLISCLSIIFPLLATSFITTGLLRFIFTTIGGMLISLFLIYLIGLDSAEKLSITKFKNKILKGGNYD